MAFTTLFDNKMSKNELIFDHSITEMHDLCEDDIETSLKIGILSQEKLFGKITELKKYYSFVHKSNQEFFAALHILVNKIQLSDIRDVLNCELDKILEFGNMITFVSGLNPEMGREMANMLFEAAEKDPRIQQYRQEARSRYDQFFTAVQNVILAVIVECGMSQQQQQKFCLKDISVDNKNVGKIIASLPHIDTPRLASIYMEGDYTYDEEAYILDIHGYLDAAAVLPHIANSTSLQKVVLYSCNIGETRVPFPHSLRVLWLGVVQMCHDSLCHLYTQLENTVNLRRLTLGGLECETHGELWEGECAPLSVDLTHHLHMEWLGIGNCGEVVCSVPTIMSSLREVCLYRVTISAAMLDNIYRTLPSNIDVRVELQYVTVRREGIAIPSAILSNIRQTCRRVEEDEGDVEREDGKVKVNKLVFYR